MDAGTTTVANVGAGPSTDKARIKSTVAPVNGNYVFETADTRFLAANALAAVSKAIDTFETAYGAPVKWAFSSPQLAINHDAGEMLNAYYQRNSGSLNFFHATDKVTGELVRSGASGEVVAHEAGHAILDGVRPGYLSSWSPDPGGFHESFGDVLAMLVGLKDERVLDKVVEQTAGDLGQQNVAAHLGEELGMAINHQVGGNATGGDWTRNAINDFKWQDPKTLPANAGPDKLSREPHSYSRLWTGAVYDIIKDITNENLAAGQGAKQAISGAADEMLKLYGKMMKLAPNGSFAYKDMAQALVKASEDVSGGAHTGRIRSVMAERLILPQTGLDDYQIPTGDTQVIEATLKGAEFGQFEGARVSTVVDSGQSFAPDEGTEQQLQADLKSLIDDGRIKYTMPGQRVSDRELIDAHGEPYVGVVRWDGQGMLIERNPVLT